MMAFISLKMESLFGDNSLVVIVFRLMIASLQIIFFVTRFFMNYH
jgi:hypothetical protein